MRPSPGSSTSSSESITTLGCTSPTLTILTSAYDSSSSTSSSSFVTHQFLHDDLSSPFPDPHALGKANYITRPSIYTRQSSGNIVISRYSPVDQMNRDIVVEDEEYDEGDARSMSPRRSSFEIERMGEDARRMLEEQARTLQANLLEIVDRIEIVKSEHEKLEGGNKFLQSYIGELMQTSKITSSSMGSGAPIQATVLTPGAVAQNKTSTVSSKNRGRTGRK